MKEASLINDRQNAWWVYYKLAIDSFESLGYCIINTSSFFDMSKKISKKDSAIRTISLAVGSLSLLVIAVSHVTNKDLCISSAYTNENQVIVAWVFYTDIYSFFLGEFI